MPKASAAIIKGSYTWDHGSSYDIYASYTDVDGRVYLGGQNSNYQYINTDGTLGTKNDTNSYGNDINDAEFKTDGTLVTALGSYEAVGVNSENDFLKVGLEQIIISGRSGSPIVEGWDIEDGIFSDYNGYKYAILGGTEGYIEYWRASVGSSSFSYFSTVSDVLGSDKDILHMRKIGQRIYIFGVQGLYRSMYHNGNSSVLSGNPIDTVPHSSGENLVVYNSLPLKNGDTLLIGSLHICGKAAWTILKNDLSWGDSGILTSSANRANTASYLGNDVVIGMNFGQFAIVSFNSIPEITLTSPSQNQTFSEVDGYKTISVSGTVSDEDDDTVTVTATIAGVSKFVTVDNCAGGKLFELVFDVASDNIPENTHDIQVVADDGK